MARVDNRMYIVSTLTSPPKTNKTKKVFKNVPKVNLSKNIFEAMKRIKNLTL